jgi:hypothetical protein
MLMLKLVISAACLSAATIAEAEPIDLSGREIRDLVAGTTVEIDAPMGAKLPLRYTAGGQVFGEAHELASYLGAASDSGRWWVASDQLCHKWNRWFDSEPQCLRLRKEGQRIRWRSADGHSGTAVITAPAPMQTAATAPRAEREGLVEDEAQTQSAPPVMRSESTETSEVQPARAGEAALFKVANVAPDDVLNVRGGPSADFDVIGELPPGSRGVAITGTCQSLWCPVRHELTSGWVNRMYLTNEEPLAVVPTSQRSSTREDADEADRDLPRRRGLDDAPGAPRSCLTPAARGLLERIEDKFGPVKVISTCRSGATIAGTGRSSRHASGNAIDFDPGSRKAEIVQWLIANHHDGGTMTYAGMDHIHVDIGPHFVSLAGGPHWASWHRERRDIPTRRERASSDDD